MKNLLLLLALFSLTINAQVQVGSLPAIPSVALDDLLIVGDVSETPTKTRKATLSQIMTLITSGSGLDATTTTKGVIKLAGDLTGTAAMPTIKSSVALSGNPTTTTQAAGNNSTRISTTAYADALVADAINNGTLLIAPSQNAVFDALALKYDTTTATSALALKANLASPALTGNPTAPTQSAGNNSTRIATTAYANALVADAINDSTTAIAPSQNAVFDALALKAALVSPALTGTPTTPTGSPLAGGTTISSQAYADASSAAVGATAATNLAALTLNYSSVRPSIILDFANSRTLDPRVTYTRSTTKTCIDYRGIIVTVAINAPCFDHDPTTLESLGLLIEEARTNLALYNEQLNNASGWTNTRLNTVTANSIAGPDNVVSMDRIIEDSTATNSHYVFQSFSVTSGTNYSASFWAKQGTRQYIQPIFNSAGFTSSTGPTVDLSTCTETANSISSPSGTYTAVYKMYAGSLCKISFTAAATATTTAQFQVRLCASTTCASYTGDNASYVDAGYVQIEAGAFTTSYSGATTSSSFARTADSVTMTGTNFSSWYNDREGTVLVKYRTPPAYVGSSDPYLFSIYTDTSNRIAVRHSSTPNIYPAITTLTAAQVTGMSQSAAFGTINTTVFGFKLDSFDISTSGSAVANDPSGSLPAVTTLSLGSNVSSTNIWNGHILKWAFIPKKLSNTEIPAESQQ